MNEEFEIGDLITISNPPKTDLGIFLGFCRPRSNSLNNFCKVYNITTGEFCDSGWLVYHPSKIHKFES